ncbi:MAG: hypothetical protein M2R45_00962 [Verrucomicrobia subdivision 3 bacterium]|nr:hypothetical protein [Limisphaerales bacterium]MCS1414630.1 hypothetical protein [Limisphaerales bacterium]
MPLKRGRPSPTKASSTPVRAGLNITATTQKDIASAVLEQEGFFQTRIAGTGIAILHSLAPQREIRRLDIGNNNLWVDENFVLMRSESAKFRVEKSSKS